MKRVVCALVIVASSVGCGGATASGGGQPVSSLNIPDADWAPFAVPEAGLTLSMPAAPERRVSTRDDGVTFEYVGAREPVAFIAASEHLGAVITPDHENDALDAVAQLFSTRALEPARGCTNGPVSSFTVAGHVARLLVSTDCTALNDGALAAVAFIHGSSLVSLVVVGEAVSGETVQALMGQMVQSIQFGEAPSWFMPLEQRVEPANVPGLSFTMPAGVQTELVQAPSGANGHYTSEPIRGMAAIVNVTVPATLPASGYCAALEASGQIALPERRDGAGFCQVRGRHAGEGDLFEIHRVDVRGNIVVELVWIGPNLPAFVAGGDAQLDAIGASVSGP